VQVCALAKKPAVLCNRMTAGHPTDGIVNNSRTAGRREPRLPPDLLFFEAWF
jgi:hypothetical protein